MTADWVRETVRGLVPTFTLWLQLILASLWSCVVPVDRISSLFNVKLGSRVTLIHLNMSVSATQKQN